MWKNQKKGSLLLLLLLAFSSVSVQALQSITEQQNQLTQNSVISYQNKEIPLSSLPMILQQQKVQLSQQTEEQQNLNNDSAELSSLLTDQLSGLIELQSTLELLSSDNSELTLLLNSSLETIKNLRRDLEVALDRIGDAEDGAISLLDQNTVLYNLAKSLEHDVALLQRQQKAQRWAFAIGGAAFVGGGTTLGYGIAKDNSTMALIGGAVILSDVLVYVLGDFVFGWW
jgi:hypothetical protein